MNYVACEQFMDYAYGEESIVTEGFINSLKNTLKKICASLYRRCNFLYERNKTKHPKIANIFKRLAMFFKKHSNIVDKANTEQDVKRDKENIDKENIDKENIDKGSQMVKDAEAELKRESSSGNNDDLNKTKSDTASSIYNRHKEAERVIRDAVDNISKNSETSSETSKLLDDIDKMLNDMNDPDISESIKDFKSSVAKARKAGVSEDKILKNKKDIDNYFTK